MDGVNQVRLSTFGQSFSSFKVHVWCFFIQVDIIYLLVKRKMVDVVEDIFSYFDEDSLRNCEIVSKSWYSAIKNGKFWKNLFKRESNKKKVLQTYFERNKNKLEENEYHYKKLFNAPQHLNNNWTRGNFQTKSVPVGEMTVTNLTMDAKRIVFALKRPKSNLSSSIMVWNRWTLETECVLEAPIKAKITDLELYGELIFCSHATGSIFVWNLITKTTIARFPGKQWAESVDIHIAHGLLVACYGLVIPQLSLASTKTEVIIRRIFDPPSKMEIEETEMISQASVCMLESDSNYFGFVLESVFGLRTKFQLRSSANFQILRELDISFASSLGYSNGWLVTANEEEIKIWDAETLKCHSSWLANKPVEDIYITSRHVIASDSKNKFTVWDSPSKTGTQPRRTQNGLFQFELLEEERGGFFHGSMVECVNFDEFQFVTISERYGCERSPVSSDFRMLNVRDFM